MKKLLILLVLAAALWIGAGAAAGRLLRAGVEAGGSYAFDAGTRLRSASVSLIGGGISLSDLEVENPRGFGGGRALRAGRIDVSGGLRTLLSDPIEIERIEVRSPEIVLEIASGGTNIGKLLANLDRRRQPEETELGKMRRLRVGLVRVTTPRVTLAQSLVARAERTFDLPPLEVRDLSMGGDITLADLLLQLLGQLAVAAGRQAGMPAGVARLLEVETAIGSLRRRAEGVLDTLRKEAEGAVRDLEGILRRKDR